MNIIPDHLDPGGSVYVHLDFLIGTLIDGTRFLVKDPNDGIFFKFEVICKTAEWKSNYAQLNKAFISESNTYFIKRDELDDFLDDDGTLKIEAKVTIMFEKFAAESAASNQVQSFDNLSKNFRAMLFDKSFCDFTFVVKGKEIKIHKSVLSARSPVFMRMFLTDMQEAKANKAEITDVEADTFDKLLVFIYSGKVAGDFDFLAIDLFIAADKYGIEDLKQLCESKIAANLSKDNALAVYDFACFHPTNINLKEKALKIIREEVLQIYYPINVKEVSDIKKMVMFKKGHDDIMNLCKKMSIGKEATAELDLESAETLKLFSELT